LRGPDPKAHIALGKALRGLMDENGLVIGSGFSFHNPGAFSWQGMDAPDPAPDHADDAFQNWLIEVCTGSDAPAEREQHLIEWRKLLRRVAATRAKSS
jgi:4,5-DOPA dioxygenase extradiol